MSDVKPYDRLAAVRYAHNWAHSRNPAFYNFDNLGGDCTNFASQCLYAGAGVMNYTPDYGWYYKSVNSRAPAWTGVQYFYHFLTREKATRGPFAIETSIDQILPGDFIQLRFTTDAPFGHNPVVVAVLDPVPEGILVAAHSEDSDYRPLSTYPYVKIRCLHVLGVYD